MSVDNIFKLICLKKKMVLQLFILIYFFLIGFKCNWIVVLSKKNVVLI